MKRCRHYGNERRETMRYCPMCSADYGRMLPAENDPANLYPSSGYFPQNIPAAKKKQTHAARRLMSLVAALAVVLSTAIGLTACTKPSRGSSGSPSPEYTAAQEGTTREESTTSSKKSAAYEIEYREAYASVVQSILTENGKYLDDADYSWFGLVDIDGDTTPEMMIGYSNALQYFQEIYRFDGSKAVKVGAFGVNNRDAWKAGIESYMKIFPGKSMIYEYNNTLSNVTETVYSYKNGRTEIKAVFTAKNNALFYFNGDEVTFEVFQKMRISVMLCDPDDVDFENGMFVKDELYELNWDCIRLFLNKGYGEPATTHEVTTQYQTTTTQLQTTTAPRNTEPAMASFIGKRTKDVIDYFGKNYELDGIISFDSPVMIYPNVTFTFNWESEWDGTGELFVTGNEIITSVVLNGDRSDVILDDITFRTTFGELRRRFDLHTIGREPEEEPILMDGNYWVNFAYKGYDLTFAYPQDPSDGDMAQTIYICSAGAPNPYG